MLARLQNCPSNPGAEKPVITPDLSPYLIHENPGHDLREKLANLIDSNGHAPQPVDRDVMHNAPYVLIVCDKSDNIIAGTCIKFAQQDTAEFGFSIVQNAFRRTGLGYWMTQRRLSRAGEMGISLVYSMVRDNNQASRNNLKKSGFRHAGRYLHRSDQKIRLDWYVKMLRPMSRRERNSLMRQIISDRIAVIH